MLTGPPPKFHGTRDILPPSSAISNWNPPRKTGTYSSSYRFSSPATSLPAADLVFWKVSHGCRGPVCLTDRFISYNVRFATML